MSYSPRGKYLGEFQRERNRVRLNFFYHRHSGGWLKVTCCSALAVLILCGCSQDKIGLGKLFEVTGEISFKDEPIPGAIIEFVPKEDITEVKAIQRAADAPRTFAVVGEDGAFAVRTVVPEGTKLGAQPGEYLVSVTWVKPLDPNDKDSSMGPNLLPAKYQDPQKSLIEFEIVAGQNRLPAIELNP